jgi:hypothetical protein
MMMNVYEEIPSVQQIHFVEIHLDRLLYVNFDLLENEKFLFDFFFCKCDCISGYKMLAERAFCEGK